MFNNILGNEENKKILENSINNGKISHSYIFSGIEGIGKFLFAKEFAKAILCEGKDKPCNKCESCIKFNNGNNPDIIIIDEEENSIKTENIKQMVKSVYEKPLNSYKKIYIINNSDNMTKEAQNSLLKTLEEPPEYIVIVLIVENENMLLNTIKSRCTKIQFNSLKDIEIKEVLKENSKQINDNLLEFAEGSIKKALAIIEKEDIITEIKNIFYNLEKINIIDLLNKKDIIFKDKESIQNTMDYINVAFLNKIKENNKYINCINIVENSKDRLNKNSNFDMTIDNLLLKVWEEVNG